MARLLPGFCELNELSINPSQKDRQISCSTTSTSNLDGVTSIGSISLIDADNSSNTDNHIDKKHKKYVEDISDSQSLTINPLRAECCVTERVGHERHAVGLCAECHTVKRAECHVS